MNYGLKQRDILNILKALEQFPKIEQAIIFGSRAKGNYKKGSDIDLAIRGKNVKYETVTRLRWSLNEEYPIPYFSDIVHYENIKNKELIEHIDRVGETIYKIKL